MICLSLWARIFISVHLYFHLSQSNATNLQMALSTMSTMLCIVFSSASEQLFFPMFFNSRGYRVNLCRGATSRSFKCSLRHCSFRSHHWMTERVKDGKRYVMFKEILFETNQSTDKPDPQLEVTGQN